ncbi:MAG: HAMP domain-containing histidine kinase [Cyclobacteriaceae bacterium]|nr:HAMP domain-containing histidine kinase [Cyclobacteriaceae bacterium]
MLIALFTRLLLGNTKPESRAEYKVALLRGQLGVLCFLVVLVYLIFDSTQGIYILVPSYIMVMVVSVLTIALNRTGYYLASSLTFLLLISILTYFFAVNDSSQSGVFVYFIMAALTAMVLFGYNNRIFVVLFCLFLVFLFLSAYLFPLPWFVLSGEEMDRINAEEYRLISFIINFLGGFILCTAVVYFLMDMNHHSQKEILEKNTLLTKTNQELDRFVYSASHELRAPLTSLLGLVDIASRSSEAIEVKQCHQMMTERIHNLDMLIKEIIDFSRNTRVEIQLENIVLRPFVEQLTEELKFMAVADKVQVQLIIDPHLEIKTDKARLQVILNNLISNAFKYVDLQKQSREIKISAVLQNKQLLLTIADNGIGISKEYHKKIFDMFFRASVQSSGSGLGLYIVQDIVTRLHGSIRVESVAGEGSTFVLMLPAA